MCLYPHASMCLYPHACFPSCSYCCAQITRTHAHTHSDILAISPSSSTHPLCSPPDLLTPLSGPPTLPPSLLRLFPSLPPSLPHSLLRVRDFSLHCLANAGVAGRGDKCCAAAKDLDNCNKEGAEPMCKCNNQQVRVVLYLYMPMSLRKCLCLCAYARRDSAEEREGGWEREREGGREREREGERGRERERDRLHSLRLYIRNAARSSLGPEPQQQARSRHPRRRQQRRPASPCPAA